MPNRRVIAAAFGGPEVLQVLSDGAPPEPGPGEVRVRVEASSAVFTDTLIRRGLYPYLRQAPPLVLGYDFVGRVDRLGDGVRGLEVGARVADLTRLGGNADYVVRPADRLLPVPEDADAAEAVSLLLSYMTAYQMLHRVAAVRPGARVLVHGASGAVGSALLQLARLADLRVVATASADKLDLALDQGALAVDRRAPDLWARLADAAPDGYDAVFDGVGLSSFSGSFDLLAPGGVLVVFGAVGPAQGVTGRTPESRAFLPFLFAQIAESLAVWNALPGGRAARFYDVGTSREERPDEYAADLADLFVLLTSGRIRPIIDERLPLDDAVRAHEKIDAGLVRGRLVYVTGATGLVG